MCTSAASVVESVGSFIRPLPMCGATDVSTQMRGLSLVPSVASVTKPRGLPAGSGGGGGI